MNVIGFDPGLKGGIAVITDELVKGWPMPLVGNEIDISSIKSILFEYSINLAVIERAASRPGQGVASTFSFGKGYGILLGMLSALSIPTVVVMPQMWKKVVLAGTKKDKDAAIMHVSRRYPTVELRPGKKRTDHDGIADAVCIAEFHSCRLARQN